MKIAIQTILFNAEKNMPDKMLLAWLEQADKNADYVFITEGATRAVNHYWDGDTSFATVDGRSTDNTVKIIEEFIKDKPKFFFKKADGFWDGKTQMLNYWMNHPSKPQDIEYIWQIDGDEFYLDEDFEKIKNLLQNEKPSQVDFFANHFWGDFNHCIDEESDGHWANAIPWSRIFKVNNESSWITHEPPRMNFSDYQKVIDKYQTLKIGLKLYHYSYVTEDQVLFKSNFYKNPEKIKLYKEWLNDNSLSIFNCKVNEFHQNHPLLIKKLIENNG
jgi:glycosyltransferase involved in cell wall biosynthesis